MGQLSKNKKLKYDYGKLLVFVPPEGTRVRCSTDIASDYGLEGWEFECLELQARIQIGGIYDDAHKW